MVNTISNSKIRVLNLSTYTTPSIIERKNKLWVEYGDDNDYYGYLIDMFHGSPTNNRCVKGIADLIYGQGIDAKRSNRNLGAYVELRKLFDEKCLRNVVMDLKLLGQACFQIVKTKDKKKIAKVYHFPIQTIRPEKCNDKGEIDAYYYFHDWTQLKRGQEPKRIPNFEFNPEAPESLLVIRPYSTGTFYFSPVDYQGGLQYAELETEIANYHINNIKNGLAPSMLINFNNGEPPEETKLSIEGAIMSKWSGSSNAGRAIISWNDSADTKADITAVPLSDAHNQYQFMSSESQDKVLVAHGITSPLIFGIKNTANGFSSNAEELKTSIVLFDNMVIRPFQNMICEAMNMILSYQEVNLELYFKPLNPLQGDELMTTNEDKDFAFKFSDQIGVDMNDSSVELDETYNDYPDSAVNNAKRAVKYAEENGWGECGTGVGKARAHQLANKENISRDTIARMASFRRHQQNKDVPYTEGCGGLMWDAWGGESGIAWAERKLEQIDKKDLSLAVDNPCWDGYEMVGFKTKNGVKVPNCVPIEQAKINRKSMAMSDNDENDWLLHLADKGEKIDESEWELVDISPVENTDDEADIHSNKFEFFKRFAEPNAKSTDDKGIFKIRYRYGPDKYSSNSRIFCKDMVANRNLNVVYRREDILTMGDEGINGQFAPAGKSSYSIWKFKGGVNCHHYWERLTFKRKQTAGKFLPLQPNEIGTDERDLENYRKVPNLEATASGVPFSPPAWSKAKTRPIDMPNNGGLKK